VKGQRPLRGQGAEPLADSTIESEFVDLAAAGNEAEWLRNLIYEIPLWPKSISPISIHCDSAGTLAKAYSQIYNGKSRHLAESMRKLTFKIGEHIVSSQGARLKELPMSR
ncbi:hypothetical protein Tco_0762170, partial [Tanacetum coccineum]